MSWGIFPDGRTGLPSLLDPLLESSSLDSLASPLFDPLLKSFSPDPLDSSLLDPVEESSSLDPLVESSLLGPLWSFHCLTL